MFYKELTDKKKAVREFIREHPNATYREIKKNLHIKVEKVYKNGIKGAFLDAGINLPRTFDKKTKEEKRKLIIEFIKKNPKASTSTIRKEFRINNSSVFSSIKRAYKEAGINYPREESYQLTPNEKRNRILEMIKDNPNSTIQELSKATKTNLYHLFKNLDEVYDKAGVKRIGLGKKRKIRKKEEIIRFIQKNTLATQREINKNCKTKVQEIFDYGIFEAYKQAEVNYPYERLKVHGSAVKEIKRRAKQFEEVIAVKLSGYGHVNRLVKTSRGIVDIIFERKDKKAIIEVKDYLIKEISFSEVKQLNKYLEDCDCNLGFLICHNKPQKDRFLIGKNKIILLSEFELNQIPHIIDMGS
jgi:predicted HTH transcriptional regulator